VTASREEYLATLRAQLVAQRGGANEPPPAPSRIAAPTLTLSDAPVAPTAPKNCEPAYVAEYHDRVVARHDLDEVARILSRESLEVLLQVAQRLARAEGRAT
jgi:hypothetical protein